MVMYIQHIIWRFVKYKPYQFRLMDVRYNIMKYLILGNCDHLIKFILFGDEKNKDENGYKENKENEKVFGHIPRNRAWPGKKFIKDDDIDHLDHLNISKVSKLKKRDELSKLNLENNLELAIYICEGKF